MYKHCFASDQIKRIVLPKSYFLDRINKHFQLLWIWTMLNYNCASTHSCCYSYSNKCLA